MRMQKGWSKIPIIARVFARCLRFLFGRKSVNKRLLSHGGLAGLTTIWQDVVVFQRCQESSILFDTFNEIMREKFGGTEPRNGVKNIENKNMMSQEK